jgi:hypothetical protein
MRMNQSRVCRLLLQDAPELLLQLRQRRDIVYISGDPTYFPAFRTSRELELSHWLSVTSASNRAYFAETMQLLALLVRGRNLRNVETVRALLPYALVEAAITSPLLNASHLHAVSQFTIVALDAYIDHEPHEVMTLVKTVRIWDNVERAAESRKLSSRLTTVIDVDWARFDAFKRHLLAHARRFLHQYADEVVEVSCWARSCRDDVPSRLMMIRPFDSCCAERAAARLAQGGARPRQVWLLHFGRDDGPHPHPRVHHPRLW